LRQYFIQNALEADDALLFPLRHRSDSGFNQHRWMRSLAPLLRFDSDPVRPNLDPASEQILADLRAAPGTGEDTTRGPICHILCHQNTRWFIVIYLTICMAAILFLIPPASVVIVGIIFVFLFLFALSWALTSSCE
jgi:hypothetical protein